MLIRTRTSPDMYEITARHRFKKKKNVITVKANTDWQAEGV